MKLFLDIGHPAHVHYFRSFIQLMEERGHRFFITARQREHVCELLEAYHIPYISRGRGGTSVLGKFLYLIKTVYSQYQRARAFRPDIFLDFSTIYSGPAAFLLRKPYITFTDTENTRLYRRLIRPFCSAVYTPASFRVNLGRDHSRFNGLMELASLAHFAPNREVLDMVDVKQGQPFAVVRFVDWKALHDRGKRGFSESSKIELVKRLSQQGRVLISSEGPLPAALEYYRLRLPSHFMHHLLYYASLYVGEGATMACEAAVLGVPSVYLSGLRPGYLQYLEEKYALVHCFDTSPQEQQAALTMCQILMTDTRARQETQKRAQQLSADHVDVTRFMADVIESWKQ